MDIYANNNTCYHYYSNGMISRSAARRCPYCRHELPECDCGYGLIAFEPKPSVAGKSIKKIFTLLYLTGKKFFTIKIHRHALHSR